MAKNEPDGLEKTVKDNAHSIILGALVLLVGFSVLTRVANKQKDAELKKADEAKQMQEKSNPGAKVVEAGKYTTKKGDTLWSISKKYYQNEYAWSAIANENKLANADMLVEGRVLIMPKVDTSTLPQEKLQEKQVMAQKQVVSPTPAEKATVTGTSYKVVKGDSLWSISVKTYGDGYGWTKIWKANKLANPDYIEAGQVLSIPR